MADRDLSTFDDQQRATYWTGALVRNAKLLEITLRTILRSLGRLHPADPVPGEPADFEPLLAAVSAGIAERFAADAELATELGDALEAAGSAHRNTIAMIDALWGVLEGTDVFQLLDLLPSDPERRVPGVRVDEGGIHSLRRAQVRAYVRLGGVEKVVRHASYEAPFDTEDDRARRHAQVRGEFELLDDGSFRVSAAPGVVRPER